MGYSIEAWQALHRLTSTLGMDPERYRRLADLEARYHGLENSDRPSWYVEDDKSGNPIPVEAKCPSVRYNLAKRATDECADLALGLAGGPTVTAEAEGGDGNDDATSDAIALLADHSGWSEALRNAAIHMIATGGAALTMRPDVIPARRITWDYHPARHCIPVFGDDDPEEAARLSAGPHDLIRLRILYAYAEHDPRTYAASGADSMRWFIFRRDFDSEAIVDFERIEVTHGGVFGGNAGSNVVEWRQSGNATQVDDNNPPSLKNIIGEVWKRATDALSRGGAGMSGGGDIWQETSRVAHGLGQVPAVWLRTAVIAHDSEGPGVFEAALNLLDAANTRLSQLDESTGYNLDPMPVIAGGLPNQTLEIRRGGGYMLQIPRTSDGGANPTATHLEIAGTSHAAARELLKELRAMATEVMRVIVRREGELGGAISGTAIQLQHRPMISLVTQLRNRLAEGIEQACKIMVLAGLKYRKSLQIVGGALPASFRVTTFGFLWPPVYPPTAEEITQMSQALGMATGTGILSKQTATRMLCAALGVQDVEGELAKIKEEQGQAMEMAREMMVTTAGADDSAEDDSIEEDDAEPAATEPAEPAATEPTE